MEKIRVLLKQIDESIAQDNANADEFVEFTPSQLTEISSELNASLKNPATEMSKEEKSRREKAARELKRHSEKLAEYNRNMEILGDRNSYSKTDKDATFMHMKEDAMGNGQTNSDCHGESVHY